MSQDTQVTPSQMMLDMPAGWHTFVATQLEEREDPSYEGEEGGSEVDHGSYTEAYSDLTYELYQQAGEVFMGDDPTMTPETFIQHFILPVLNEGKLP